VSLCIRAVDIFSVFLEFSQQSMVFFFFTIALTGLKYVHMLHNSVLHIYCVLYLYRVYTHSYLLVHMHNVPGGWNLLTLVTCM
jgi:hypothetical protein